ncbi:AtpZ/AtpI family protein [Hansschlegelia quercus]|uniref:ATP synthase protein I n=1 Tax=Hansschlegelia quercus TaxID=2528245 RepID=A0A4Q9GNX6_9HYPH|nr:AtpZ/AtpI family protein [Hansschlegelia quercus]TBN53267.1 F0F1 ATP synthase assembly protein I [Hansschlegelia quercus]
MAQGSDGNPGVPPQDGDGDLTTRLDRLGRELKRRTDAEATQAEGERNARSDYTGMSQALRLGSEFVAGVVAGAAVGWAFDYVLETKPWGLIVFLLLGFAAGVLNVMRSAGLAAQPGSKR